MYSYKQDKRCCELVSSAGNRQQYTGHLSRLVIGSDPAKAHVRIGGRHVSPTPHDDDDEFVLPGAKHLRGTALFASQIVYTPH